MTIIYIFIAIAEITIALACLYMTCISIAFVLHKFCNMIMIVAQTTVRSIINHLLPKMGKHAT